MNSLAAEEVGLEQYHSLVSAVFLFNGVADADM
jgi:hypothetical protein